MIISSIYINIIYALTATNFESYSYALHAKIIIDTLSLFGFFSIELFIHTIRDKTCLSKRQPIITSTHWLTIYSQTRIVRLTFCLSNRHLNTISSARREKQKPIKLFTSFGKLLGAERNKFCDQRMKSELIIPNYSSE